MKKKILIVISVLAGLLFLIIGIPVIINECYKVGGYITLWNAEDVLSYYGAIIAAIIGIIMVPKK